MRRTPCGDRGSWSDQMWPEALETPGRLEAAETPVKPEAAKLPLWHEAAAAPLRPEAAEAPLRPEAADPPFAREAGAEKLRPMPRGIANARSEAPNNLSQRQRVLRASCPGNPFQQSQRAQLHTSMKARARQVKATRRQIKMSTAETKIKKCPK